MIDRTEGIKSAIKYLKQRKVYNNIRLTIHKDLIELEKLIDKSVKLNKGKNIDYRYN